MRLGSIELPCRVSSSQEGLSPRTRSIRLLLLSAEKQTAPDTIAKASTKARKTRPSTRWCTWRLSIAPRASGGTRRSATSNCVALVRPATASVASEISSPTRKQNAMVDHNTAAA